MLHINKVKTFHGVKWAVVGEVTRYKKEGDKCVKFTELLPVEYSTESTLPLGGKMKNQHVAVFPYTPEGLVKAKELRKNLSR